MASRCRQHAKNGVLDMTYLEHRLDAIESRIDDLCGLLGEVLERIDRGQIVAEIMTDIKEREAPHRSADPLHDCFLMQCPAWEKRE